MGSIAGPTLVAAFVLVACGDAPPETPIETVRRFLTVMDRSAFDASQLRDAYELLDAGAQRELRERATRAETLTGRAFAPWEMLAQGRFRLRFAPAARRGMRERVTGTRAVVVVVGDGGERVEVPLVHEGGRWRVQLAVPALSGTGARSP